jgi:SAM-dependent methyltransferase
VAAVDLARRSREPELMDEEPVGFEEIDRTLKELATINRLSLAYRPTLAWLDRLAREGDGRQGAPLTILDVACGHGDMLRRIWRWSRHRGVAVELTGVDINPEVIRSARAATPPDVPIRYEQRDAFAPADGPAPDVIISSLFAHHLFDDALVRFVRWMHATAKRSWLVNDLHRHPVPYHFTRAWFRAAGFGRLVVNDGPVSVARGFTRAEWVEVLREAGVDPAGVEIAWFVPFRYRVACLR